MRRRPQEPPPPDDDLGINIIDPGFSFLSFATVSVVLLILFVLAMLLFPANARDNGQWDATDADVAKWYRDLRQPDAPNMSCCGEADAYYADSFEVNKKGQTVATVTDTRDDATLGRPHIKPGTKIIVPDYKMKYDAGNPTGHGVIFVRWDDDNATFGVLCYVTPGGV